VNLTENPFMASRSRIEEEKKWSSVEKANYEWVSTCGVDLIKKTIVIDLELKK
jgi:hypothetical protein